GRYIRVQLNSTGYVILAEVEVIGCMPANLCVNQGGDADGDGVCADIDCNDADPSIPAAPGTICDDGNPNTTNDIIQSDGCTCAGTPINSGDVLAANVHPKFVNLLPDPLKINATNGGTFNLTAEQSPQWLGLQNANGTPILTNVWGYSYNGQQMILGPTFNIQKDVAIDVKWRNNLPFTHLLPVDETIHQARPSNGTPMVVHLHGGHTESASDGYPEAWFTQNYAETGPEWKKSTYHYTNDQEATMLWYHDHTLGQTRLQNYAGLSGMYIIRDANEASLNLPSGEYEREIVIQDKQFANNGSLYFPALLSDPEALDFPTDPNIEPTIFTEFFGDYILVNGMVWPKMNVEPTQYRLRLLNGSDSRFYIFKLSNGATFQQIGTDGGLLNHPVNLTQLILAPAERADIIVDFSGMAGQSVILQNVGPDEPFKGLAANQPPADPSTTGVIMRFDVQGTANASFVIPSTLRPTIKYLGQETNTRQLLLLESTDMYGRLKPSLGTAQQGQLGWVEPTTETPIIGETEVWEIYNNTEDAHPIHVHQIEFQLVNRQKFTGALDSITSQLTNIQLIGPPIAPAPNEQGWKDTYIVPPGQVARFKVKFDLLGKFVWHCHILSHEDWDMMRPMEVMPASAGGSNCSTTSNLALGKSTSQSSTITAGGITGLSSKAVDGNTNGVFFTSPPSASSVSATNYENQAWWEVDLGAIYNIDEVNIFNRTDGTDKTGPCYLLISNTPFANDLATARSQAHYEHFEPGQVGSPTSVTPNVSGRYVRVQLAGTGYMILAEVEVNGCSVNQPLAVPNMINFTAKKEGQQTHVSWLMAKDVDVDFYEVEVSTDGNEFELLEETLSSRANAPRSYELTDFHPSTGENFYRLKIYNLDGTSYYSAIRRVNFDINFDKIIIYPNPTNHKINITLRDFAGKEGLVEIYNHLGQKQYEQYYQSLPSIPMSLDVSKFTPGIYTVSIKIDNQKRFAKQFVVMDR
ncbi:MAG TPA: T9SS type A sorting domain-containing protein, partial [Phaeodactylibacter sp.]|nr:T9SS type A sorting domain-containing protein [Phaeodactylibacter sp.]